MFAAKGLQVYLKQGNLLELPYEDNFFDTVLLISILEHLRPKDLARAFAEIRRVLKSNGNVVYGVPVDSPITRGGFLMLGYNIAKHHFSNERQVRGAARSFFPVVEARSLSAFGIKVYEVVRCLKDRQSR